MTPHDVHHAVRNRVRSSWPLFITIALLGAWAKQTNRRTDQRDLAGHIHDALAPHLDAITDAITGATEVERDDTATEETPLYDLHLDTEETAHLIDNLLHRRENINPTGAI